MVDYTMHTDQADKKKQMGNDEFKKGNFRGAIEHFTDAIGKSRGGTSTRANVWWPFSSLFV